MWNVKNGNSIGKWRNSKVKKLKYIEYKNIGVIKIKN